ncbi:hypothetical protein PHJA_002675800 [Phtheirospermum japonicum]|uniref:Uncharacterized protein n=1 Tax=Phtheirospermum japonicum TaxID=374723 RepID=A0A830D0Z5_9LAMI|nr:hypothetical protein PHJA_002675800 [Phtheirospermum japonicum]
MGDNEEKPIKVQAPTARKLGKHNNSQGEIVKSPKAADKGGEFSREMSASGEESGPISQEHVMKINHHNHRRVDKSVAGGGVILGGLATAFLVAVFCYIRATRRKPVEPCSPTGSIAFVGREKEVHGSPTNSSN